MKDINSNGTSAKAEEHMGHVFVSGNRLGRLS